MPWILTAIAAVVTSLTGAVVYLWKQNAAINRGQVQWRDEKIKTLEKKEEISEAKITALENRVSELEGERAKLEARFLVFQSSHDSSPLPCWMKDIDGRVLACNKAYEKVFLSPRGYSLQDYISNTDEAVWPDDQAKAFQSNDKLVIDTGETVDTIEICTNKSGVGVAVRVIKYPRWVHGVASPIGVAGIAIMDDLSGIKFNS